MSAERQAALDCHTLESRDIVAIDPDGNQVAGTFPVKVYPMLKDMPAATEIAALPHGWGYPGSGSKS